ncbi:MAG: hypothetical protein HY057_14255 [Rhodospirillales bacterium]|nr:hypothetical protein [Rhodospirillales bacterium]
MFANALFPAITEHHVTGGATYKINQAFEVTGSTFYAFKASQTENGAGDSFSRLGKGTTVDMYQYGAQLALKWKF